MGSVVMYKFFYEGERGVEKRGIRDWYYWVREIGEVSGWERVGLWVEGSRSG